MSALPRQRLTALVPTLWEQRLTLVVAPALAWQDDAVRAARIGRGDARRLVLGRALRRRRGGVPRAPRVVVPLRRARAADALDRHRGGRRLARGAGAARAPRVLVIDDFHVLRGLAAEDGCERLVARARGAGVWSPPHATALQPLAAARLGLAVELGPDDLRFRSWEVERLFLEHYGDPLPPRSSRSSPSARRAGPPASSCSTWRPGASRRASGAPRWRRCAHGGRRLASTSPTTCSTTSRRCFASSSSAHPCSPFCPVRCATRCWGARAARSCWRS